jgi:hypothetical protein
LGKRPSCELRVFFKITYVCPWSNHDLELLMSRAGREPAEDLKKRLVAACQEIGLTVRSAQMDLMKEAGTRMIHVDGCPENWPHEGPMLGLMVSITTGGQALILIPVMHVRPSLCDSVCIPLFSWDSRPRLSPTVASRLRNTERGANFSVCCLLIAFVSPSNRIVQGCRKEDTPIAIPSAMQLSGLYGHASEDATSDVEPAHSRTYSLRFILNE